LLKIYETFKKETHHNNNNNTLFETESNISFYFTTSCFLQQMSLLICNRIHHLTVQQRQIRSNSSEIKVLNISEVPLYCVFDEFECEGRVDPGWAFVAVPFYPMRPVVLKTEIELTYPHGFGRPLSSDLVHFTCLKLKFFEGDPRVPGQGLVRPDLVPVDTELVRSVLTIPEGTFKNFEVRQVCYSVAQVSPAPGGVFLPAFGDE
jgi:hypothetical protein